MGLHVPRRGKVERADLLVEDALAYRRLANGALEAASDLYYEAAAERVHRADALRDRADELDAEAAVARSRAKRASASISPVTP